MSKSNIVSIHICIYLATLVILFPFTTWAEEDLILDDSFQTTEVPVAVDEANQESIGSAEQPVANQPIETVDDLDSAKKEVSDYKAATKNQLILEDLPQLSNIESESTAENMNLATPFELKSSQAALFGWSIGALITHQPIYSNYTLNAINTTEVKKTSLQTEPVQTAGVVVRYAISPFSHLGVDVNFSHTISLNHSNIITYNNSNNHKQFSLTKAEFNLTYALKLAKSFPAFVFAGAGFQKASGETLLDLVNENGFGGQVGAGVTLASIINFDVSYNYYEHRLSSAYSNYLSGGTTNPSYSVDEESRVSIRGLSTRLTYNFK